MHGFHFPTEEFIHNSNEEFETWKLELEKKNCCNFVTFSGETTNKQGDKVRYYRCNRSGYYVPTNSKRKPRICGTRKIDNSCTASLHVTISENGTHTTECCMVHYGHKPELQHLNMPKDLRQQIAAKLVQGVPQMTILDQIRDNIQGECLTREHIVSEKDIQNIAFAFDTDEVRRHDNDQDSVLAWINEWDENKDTNPILFYKLQGQPMTGFHDDDFIVVLQTQAQKIVMQALVETGVLCDSTHNTTGYDFKLTSLLVIDEYGQGLPVTHCLSNKETQVFMKCFFDNVRENVGECHPKWFMSDTAPQFYDAFTEAFQTYPYHLFCTWHVDKAWRDNLHAHIKNNPGVIQEVYSYLRTVLEQTNPDKFQQYLSEIQKRLDSSAVTSSFGEYFRKEWGDNSHKWGYAYRVSLGINTNMYCEAFHKTFKYKYLKGKVNRRVDKCLVNLVKHSRNQVFSRLIKMTKGRNTLRLQKIHRSHLASEKLPYHNVTGDSQEGELGRGI